MRPVKQAPKEEKLVEGTRERLSPAKMPFVISDEKKKDILIFGFLNELRVNLYHDLKAILGDRLGKEVHKKLYNLSADRGFHAALSPDCTIRELVEIELLNFPLFGMELWGEEVVENGIKVCYEHITKCPFWNYVQMKGYKESPCDITCKYDAERGVKTGIGRWETIQRMPDGASECIYRIRPFSHFEQEETIKKLMFNRTRLDSKYSERFNIQGYEKDPNWKPPPRPGFPPPAQQAPKEPPKEAPKQS
jgi:hypothetical protein